MRLNRSESYPVKCVECDWRGHRVKACPRCNVAHACRPSACDLKYGNCPRCGAEVRRVGK
jgi:hypothetical protein